MYYKYYFKILVYVSSIPVHTLCMFYRVVTYFAEYNMKFYLRRVYIYEQYII